MKNSIASIGLALLVSAFALPAFACQGDKELFADDFSFQDLAWGDATERFTIKDGKATVRPNANATESRWNSAFTFTDADICMTVTATEAQDPVQTRGALMFWAKDSSNYYLFLVTSEGHYYVAHLLDGKWTANVVPWRESDAIKKGLNAANELRVTIKGNVVTLSINGRELGKFRGQQPDGPTSVGIFAESGPQKADAWEFSNLKVTNVK